jgi:hypothetical protein
LTPEEEALGSLVRRLEDLQIPYMVTDPTPSTLEALVESLATSGFYVDPAST